MESGSGMEPGRQEPQAMKGGILVDVVMWNREMRESWSMDRGMGKGDNRGRDANQKIRRSRDGENS